MQFLLTAEWPITTLYIVYDDGDEEEVYRDEAIALLLAANGFD